VCVCEPAIIKSLHNYIMSGMVNVQKVICVM